MNTPSNTSGHGLPCPPEMVAELTAQRPYLLRFAARRLRDHGLVEDVVQETLLAAWQGAAGFEQKASLRTWLTGILQRRIADSLRRQRRDALALAEADGDDDADAPEANDAGSGEAIDWIDPLRRLESRRVLDALAGCLGSLPPQAARLFKLRELDGLSNQEAADQLGLSGREATMLMHRTLARLRSGLRPMGHGLGDGQGCPA
jgi:RNA polymerase sigma-70 factor, ECF subfamily